MDHPHKDNVAFELTEAGSATSSTNVKTVGNTVAEKFRGTSADQHEMSVMGKQQVLRVYLASVAFLVGTIIQGLIALNVPDYAWAPWHGTLLTIAVILFSAIFNTTWASRLPVLEGSVLILHILGFFAIVIPLWVMGPRAKPEVVLLEFTNNGGWPTKGLSAMVGLLAPQAVLTGYDCSVHMSEEIKDASITLPRAIMGSMALNATLVFLMSVTLIFTLGDVDSILETTTGYPFIQVFYNTTQSYAAANTMTALIIVLLTACCISEVATASRQIWSFARDKGLPGSPWLSRVSPGWNIPLPAVIVSITITSLISLINLGSSVALAAITSLGALAVLVSYFLTIGCVLHRRIVGPALPMRRWSLGKLGLAINVAALCFLTPLIFFLTWPMVTPVVASTMNWSSIMLVGTLIIAMVFYVFKGRHEYTGPVVDVKRYE
ncbi:hypothetical protein LTR70_009917 [Exophiala xenobiotica]|uniref:Amino acid transporter n=1 Tax=Lithohypha guttulata TaxID=1690604 RepID=A0ABR0JVS9_9EURO|nr:hypothetical protein LTR24_009838 [Lithohypha guttulata]KAK5309867.1 hypothetical protein LTR70_009917 [Exophiala xenobiotica]